MSGCKKCGREFTQSGVGRPRLYCVSCYPPGAHEHPRTMLRHECQWCGKTFEAVGRDRRFCSSSCFGQASRGPKPEQRKVRPTSTCQHCGDTFSVKAGGKGRYCSKECQERGDRKSVLLRCRWCGSDFRQRASGPGLKSNGSRQRTNLYCSLPCANEALAYDRTGKGKCSPILLARCKECGASYIKRRGALFCSEDCRRLSAQARWLRPTRIVKCQTCGSEFTARQGPSRFCSVACHRRSPEYKAASREHKRRRAMMKRGVSGSHTQEQWRAKQSEYGGLCAYGCGREGTTKDHVVAIACGGTDDIENIVPACPLCNSYKQAHPVENATVPHAFGQMAMAGVFVAPTPASVTVLPRGPRMRWGGEENVRNFEDGGLTPCAASASRQP